MRFYIAITVLLMSTNNIGAQSFFRLKIVDSISKESISGATIFVEELPLGDKVSDPNGFVVYQNIPVDRKCRAVIHHPEYVVKVVEFVSNPILGPDNNLVINLEKDKSNDLGTIWGKIVDNSNNAIVGAKILLIIDGNVWKVNSDNFGYYFITYPYVVNKEQLDYRLEVIDNNCSKSFDFIGDNKHKIKKDLTMSCSSPTNWLHDAENQKDQTNSNNINNNIMGVQVSGQGNSVGGISVGNNEVSERDITHENSSNMNESVEATMQISIDTLMRWNKFVKANIIITSSNDSKIRVYTKSESVPYIMFDNGKLINLAFLEFDNISYSNYLDLNLIGGEPRRFSLIFNNKQKKRKNIDSLLFFAYYDFLEKRFIGKQFNGIILN